MPEKEKEKSLATEKSDVKPDKKEKKGLHIVATLIDLLDSSSNICYILYYASYGENFVELRKWHEYHFLFPCLFHQNVFMSQC